MRSDITPAARSRTKGCPATRTSPEGSGELQGDDPTILTLARGHYCPKEHQQHLELAANYPKINVACTRIHLRDLFREIRPDWDLGTPGLRDAWDARDLSSFYGWEERTAATESAA